MKKTIYMDLDDTFVDTEQYIREVLKNNNLPVKIPCAYALRNSDVYGEIIEKIMANYRAIPLKDGALNCLKLLRTEYDVKFCSLFYNENERKAKKEFAEELNAEIILVESGDFSKSSVNMKNIILVDDSLEVLQSANAEFKIQMFNKYKARGLSYKDYLIGDSFAENLYDVVDILLGGIAKWKH